MRVLTVQTAAVDRLRDELEGPRAGERARRPEDLAAYGFDVSSDTRLRTAAVVPRDANEVAEVVRIARESGEKIVARGAETALWGGAVPVAGGVVILFARMNRILAVDPRSAECSEDAISRQSGTCR
jgi:FAD/FMN-containing dehydrogenase